MSLAKDQSLSVVVSGKTDAVLKARKLIVQNLQTQVSSSIYHHCTYLTECICMSVLLQRSKHWF